MNTTTYLFISCCKYKKRWTRIHKMCKKLKISNYYIVYGNNRIKESKIINKMMIIKSPDNYISLPIKMTELYKFIHKINNKMNVIKIDDDVILYRNIEKLYNKKYEYQGFALVDSLTQLGNYHLYKNNVKNKVFNIKKWNDKYTKVGRVIYAAGGTTYYLSAKGLTKIVNVLRKLDKSAVKNHRFEDLIIGTLMKKVRISCKVPKHIEYLHPNVYYKNKKILTTDVYY